MDTTATNKRIRELITDIEYGRLIPNPSFQRRLVWAQKHKVAFIKTVLEGLPFPEIYIAAGDLNVDTGDGHAMLVDGQQRITTLYEYFTNSPNLQLPSNMLGYADLSEEKKRNFLEYKVVVRDLGQLELTDVINIFERINSTSYSLNAIEIANARYDNDLKDLADDISNNDFWEKHSVFKTNELKRMQDTNFILILIATIIGDYFNRDDLVEDFLIRYNDSFEQKQTIESQFSTTLGFLDDLALPNGTRAWQRADLFTLIIETHRVLFKAKTPLKQAETKSKLLAFYSAVDDYRDSKGPQSKLNLDQGLERINISAGDIQTYYTSTISGTNNRTSRIARGHILSKVLSDSN